MSSDRLSPLLVYVFCMMLGFGVSRSPRWHDHRRTDVMIYVSSRLFVVYLLLLYSLQMVEVAIKVMHTASRVMLWPTSMMASAGLWVLMFMRNGMVLALFNMVITAVSYMVSLSNESSDNVAQVLDMRYYRVSLENNDWLDMAKRTTCGVRREVLVKGDGVGMEPLESVMGKAVTILESIIGEGVIKIIADDDTPIPPVEQRPFYSMITDTFWGVVMWFVNSVVDMVRNAKDCILIVATRLTIFATGITLSDHLYRRVMTICLPPLDATWMKRRDSNASEAIRSSGFYCTVRSVDAIANNQELLHKMIKRNAYAAAFNSLTDSQKTYAMKSLLDSKRKELKVHEFHYIISPDWFEVSRGWGVNAAYELGKEIEKELIEKSRVVFSDPEVQRGLSKLGGDVTHIAGMKPGSIPSEEAIAKVFRGRTTVSELDKQFISPACVINPTEDPCCSTDLATAPPFGWKGHGFVIYREKTKEGVDVPVYVIE